MKKNDTKIFYLNSQHNSKSSNILVTSQSVCKQELVTWQNTKSGFKRKIILRRFNKIGHVNNYISKPMNFKNSEK